MIIQNPEIYVSSVLEGKELTLDEITKRAAAQGYTPAEYIQYNGFVKKSNDPANAETSVGSSNQNSVSNSENGSSDSKSLIRKIFDAAVRAGKKVILDGIEEENLLESDYYINVDDLKNNKNETELSLFLNDRLSELGITTEETLPGVNALRFKSYDQRYDEANPEVIATTPLGLGDLTEDFIGDIFGEDSAITFGNIFSDDLTDEELQEVANQINKRINRLADFDYLKKFKEKENVNLESLENDYYESVTAPKYDDDKLEEEYEKILLKKFKTVGLEEQIINDPYSKFPLKTLKPGEKPATREDFESDYEWEKYQDWKQTGVVNVDSSDDAVKNWNTNRKNQFQLDNSENYITNLTPEQRTAVKAIIKRDANALADYNDVVNDVYNSEKELNTLISEYELNPTIQTYNIAKQAELDFLDKIDYINKLEAKLIEQGIDQKAEFIPLALKDFNANYDRMAQLANGFKSLGTDLVYGAAQLGLLANPLTANLLMNPAISSEAKAAIRSSILAPIRDLGTAMDIEGAQFQRGVKIEDAFDSFQNLGRWTAGATVNLVPSLSMALTGPAALPLFFLSGYGGKGIDIAQQEYDAIQFIIENKDSEDPLVQMMLDEKAKILNMPQWRKMSSQVLNGTAEVLFERIGTMKLLKNARKGIALLPNASVKEGFKFAGKTIVAGNLREGGSEFATTITQNFGDIYILDEDKNFFEGALESFAQGAFMGTGISSLNGARAVKQALASEMSTIKDRKAMRQIVERIQKLTGAKLQSVDDVQSLDMSKLDARIKAEVEKLASEGNALQETILSRLTDGTLNEADLIQLGDINAEQRRINKMFREAAQNPNIGADQLTNFKNELQDKFDKLEKDKFEILAANAKTAKNKKAANNARTKFENTVGYALYEQAMLNQSVFEIGQDYNKQDAEIKQKGLSLAKQELKKEGIKKPTNQQIKEKAIENYINTQYADRINKNQTTALEFAKNNGFENLNFVKIEGKDSTKKTMDILEDIGFFEAPNNPSRAEMKNQIENGGFEGTYFKGTVVVNMPNSIKNRRVGIFTHEVLHAIVEKQLGDQQTIDTAGKQLLDWLEKNNKDLFAKVKFRIDRSYRDENGEKKADYYEEAMNAMSDILADGQTINESTLNAVRIFANQYIPFNFLKFKATEGIGVYNFIKKFSNSKGAFSIPNMAVGGSSSLSGSAIGRDEDLRGKLSFTFNKLDPSVRKQTVNNVLAQNANNWTTKNDPWLDSPLGQAAVGRIIQPFIPIMQSVARSNSAMLETATFEGDAESKQAAIDDAVAGGLAALLQHIKNFNPAVNNDLDAWINSYVKKKFLEGVKKVEKKSFTQRTDESTKQIADTSGETKKVDKPQYRSLTDSKVVSPKSISEIKNIVLNKVKVLKSTIEDVGGINKTVSGVVSEIKKDLQSQADIVIKKEMGGMPNNQITKYLLKNKKAIVENFTTSLLSTLIPSAIKKSVGGKYKVDENGKRVKDSNGDFIFEPNFISDWKGKKIDRAKTSTNQQGQTSGPQLMRRVMPSDADFLSSFGTIETKNGKPVIKKLNNSKKVAAAKELAGELGLEIFRDDIELGGPISKAFEKNQQMKEIVLVDNFIGEVIKQVEGRPAKFSVSKLNENHLNILYDAQGDLLSHFAGFGITNARLRNFMIDKGLTREEAVRFATKATNSIKRYVDQLDKTASVDFKEFVQESVALRDENSNLAEATGLKLNNKSYLTAGINSIMGLFDNLNLVNRQRKLFGEYVDSKVTSEAGLITILKWFTGHQTTSGKIGGNRSQIYAGMPDFIKQLNKHPDIEIQTKRTSDGKTRIFKAFYKGKEITGLTKKIKTPQQKVGPRSNFEGENYTVREKAANEAWAELLDYLGFVKNNGGVVDWVMTMMSLKSNMSSMLKAAANVKYYYVGPGIKKLKYEHLIPTEYIVLKLTQHFYGKKIDTDALRDKYTVAIIPEVMDKNVNILHRKQMTAKWDYLTMPETERYYNKAMYGYKPMFALQNLANPTQLVGQNFVRFNDIVSDKAAEVSTRNQQYDEAMNKARMSVSYNSNKKGITVLDFDDTLAKTKSKIGVTLEYQGKKETIKIDAAEFALKAAELEAQGATFDFSEFSKVVGGQKGPLFDLALKRQAKFGNKDIFILTARPQASAPAIQQFAKGLGLNLKIGNIVGLEDGRAKAKADWIVGKVNEGYNDFYFADDAYKNVKAVQDVLNVLDVKSDVQIARAKFSKSFPSAIDKMLERNKGIKAESIYSKVVARRMGAGKGRFKFFVAYGAEDFRGLTSYVIAGKGKQGELDQEFFEKSLVDPYVRGVAALETQRQSIKRGLSALIKTMPFSKRKLGKKVPGTKYTYDQALRVYLYTKGGFEVPGISKRDLIKLNKEIEKDQNLMDFASGLLLIAKKDSWIEPAEFWDSGSILQDLNSLTDKISRKEYLAEFIENVDAIFNENALNKLEATFGTNYILALKDSIRRMKTGSNRPGQPGRYETRWLNWINNAVGTIMFVNRRSALLQTISMTNFINWSDNNPIKAAAAFANQPLYWKTWVKIFNSDKLKQRRGGLRSDLQEQEIANLAKTSKNKAQAIVAYLLKKGFLPTQIADNFAIATGGAAFLINRTKTYKKQGLSDAEAEARAFQDFSKISDETQQSGDPMLISSQQSSHLGRLILAFQNTPMQYTRLMKKAGQDLINGRGDAKTNISKIAYYGFVQNLIFNALQQAVFALFPGFDDEDDVDEEKQSKEETRRITKTLNGMIDSVLRGTGIYGAIASTLKNTVMRYKQEEEKGFTGDHAYTLLEIANVSPPIGSKLRKIYNAIQTNKFDKDVIAERGFDVTIDGKFNLSPSYSIIASLSSALFNLPLDRVVIELNGVTEMLDDRNTRMQRIALGLGWRTWDVQAKNEEADRITADAKERRRVEGIEKSKITRKENKEKLEKLELKILNIDDNFKTYSEYEKWKKGKSIKDKIKYIEKITKQ